MQTEGITGWVLAATTLETVPQQVTSEHCDYQHWWTRNKRLHIWMLESGRRSTEDEYLRRPGACQWGKIQDDSMEDYVLIGPWLRNYES